MADNEINLPDGFARLNITFNRGNGDLPDPVRYDTSDVELRTMATEAILNGSIPGVTAGDQEVQLRDFVVDRFARATLGNVVIPLNNIPWDATSDALRVLALNMVRAGGVPEIQANLEVNPEDLQIIRSFFIRPKTPFGG